MAVFRVEKNHNYTVMANYHLKDNRLSLKAKGLMSIMLSLPDDWDYTLRGLACICKEGVDAIREAIRELERAGYILRSRKRNEKGQMKNTEYVIYEEPQEPEMRDDADDEDYAPILGSPTLEKPTLENPTLDHPTLENPALDHPALENPTQLNINKTNTEPKKEKNKKVRNESNPYPSNPDPIKPARAETQAQRPFNLVEQMRGIVRNHISYDVMVEEFDREQLDEIADRVMLRNAKLEKLIEQEENNEIVSVARKFNISWEALEKLAQGLLPGGEASFLMPIEDKEELKDETQEP